MPDQGWGQEVSQIIRALGVRVGPLEKGAGALGAWAKAPHVKDGKLTPETVAYIDKVFPAFHYREDPSHNIMLILRALGTKTVLAELAR